MISLFNEFGTFMVSLFDKPAFIALIIVGIVFSLSFVLAAIRLVNTLYKEWKELQNNK